MPGSKRSRGRYSVDALAAVLVGSIAVAAWANASVDTPLTGDAIDTPLTGDAIDTPLTGDAIDTPLTGQPGDPVQGRQIVENRSVGACLLCHAGPFPAPHLQGTIGPSLDGAGSRLSVGQIRLRLMDARKLNPDTTMPPYYVVDGLNRTGRQWQGRPALSAQQIEDVVAFLATLRAP